MPIRPSGSSMKSGLDLAGSLTDQLGHAVRHRYQEFLTATVHERDVPIRRLYGQDFVFDEHSSHGLVIGRAFEIDGHGRWISYRALWLLEIRDGLISRQTVWNDIFAIRRQLL
jgi:hypothetical protein